MINKEVKKQQKIKTKVSSPSSVSYHYSCINLFDPAARQSTSCNYMYKNVVLPSKQILWRRSRIPRLVYSLPLMIPLNVFYRGRRRQQQPPPSQCRASPIPHLGPRLHGASAGRRWRQSRGSRREPPERVSEVNATVSGLTGERFEKGR